MAESKGAQPRLTPRQADILKIVQAKGFATIEALARQFDVSTQTVRRDLIRLQEAQLLQRFHGGAGMPENTVRLGYAQKRGLAADAKHRIGDATARLIPDGASVFLDVGTTVEAVARALRFRRGLHIFTASLNAAAILAGADAHQVFVVGGLVRGADGSLVGDTAIANLGPFKFDCAVIGLSGFDDDGALMDFDMQKVAVKQAAIANARRVVAVADASKFERSAVVRVAPPSAVHVLVTDAPPPAALRRALTDAGLELIVA